MESWSSETSVITKENAQYACDNAEDCVVCRQLHERLRGCSVILSNRLVAEVNDGKACELAAYTGCA